MDAQLPDPPAQSLSAVLMTEHPIKKIVTPLTMGGKSRFRVFGGRKLIAISNREQTIANFTGYQLISKGLFHFFSHPIKLLHVPRIAPHA